MSETVIKKVRLEWVDTDWALIEEVARISMTTPKVILRAHLAEIQGALRKGNTTVKLPELWVKAWENLDQHMVESDLQLDSDAIDLSVLCTSRKNSSGFAGVYMHSNPARGFIAQGRDHETKKPGKHLGLFPTAVQAAWARYQHYRKHGMPYGKLEEMMDKLAQEPTWRGLPEHWIKAIAIHSLAIRGTILPDLSPEDRKWEDTNPTNEMDC